MNKTELGNCPFCGGEAYVREYSIVDRGDATALMKRFAVKCLKCDLEAIWENIEYPPNIDVLTNMISLWNGGKQ